MKHWSCGIAAGVLLCATTLSTSANAAADEAVLEQLKAMQEQINALQGQVSTLQKEATEARARAESAEAQLRLTRDYFDALVAGAASDFASAA